jgi:hypothetical protein
MMVDWEDGTTLLVPSKLALLTRLRQTLITPALYGGPPASGALEDLGEWLSEDFNNDLPALVLTPFAKAIPHIQRLAQKLGAHYYFFQGGMSEKAFNSQIDGFQQNLHTNKLLVGTIRSAASFSASQARVVYMLGYDMVPAENEQAEERGDSPKGLDIRYIMNKGTMDEHILAILNGKQMWSDIALDPHRLLHPPREE